MKKFAIFVTLIIIVVGAIAIYQHSPRSPQNRPAGGNAVVASVVNTPQNETIADLELPLVNLTGKWAAENTNYSFVAEVTADRIKIHLLTSPEQGMLYWDGTFKGSESPGNTITSDRDKDAVMLSGSDTKDFSVEDDKISFTFQILGTDTKVNLTR